jgi:hypothetical protein
LLAGTARPRHNHFTVTSPPLHVTAGQALAIAQASQGLPYFDHVLELMLHEVLEDEAHREDRTDAQLPHMVQFLRNFGTGLLDTIVQVGVSPPLCQCCLTTHFRAKAAPRGVCPALRTFALCHPS